jgi:hypothetical protein
MSSTETTIHRPSLAINIAGTVTGNEGHHSRNLVRNTASLQRIQLTDLPLGASLPGRLVHGGRHASLNQSWTYRITSDALTGQLIRSGLHDADDGRFRCRVVCCAGVRTQSGDRSGGDDAACRVGLGLGCLEHTTSSVLCGEEDAATIVSYLPTVVVNENVANLTLEHWCA